MSKTILAQRDWSGWLSGIGVTLGAACLGVALWTANTSGGVQPPAPVAPAAAHAEAAVPPSAPASAKALPASVPTRLMIGPINVDTSLFTTGLDANRNPIAPTGDTVDLAAWLDSSVTPGERGTSVIVGHVTTYKSGPSVFYNLGTMQAGQEINVERQDGTTARFTVESVESYGKDDFPSSKVYAMTDYSSLRLITCGNWDEATQHYEDNVVVFARLSE